MHDPVSPLRTPLPARAAGQAATGPAVRPWRAWLGELNRRRRTLWPVKFLGTTLGITGFFQAYFWVLQHPLAPVVVMPLTWVDQAVGYWVGALPLYLSLWVYVSLAPAMLKNWRELRVIGAAMLLMSLLGLGIFLRWPTAVPVFSIDLALHPEMALLKGIDKSGNSCPSLHVAFAVFTWAWLSRLAAETGAPRGVRAVNGAWCLAILYSTLATGQHVLLDVLAGAVMGGVIGLASARVLPGGHPPR